MPGEPGLHGSRFMGCPVMDETADPPVDDEPAPGPTDRMLAWARNSSLYRLNRRMMTEHELFEALRRKALSKFEGIGDAMARQLAGHGVDFCRQHGFLNDRTYAEVKTVSAVRTGRSRRRIARDLGLKGVARPLIEDALQEVDDLEAAIAFARRRAFGPFRKLAADEKRMAKEFAAFARNGFSSGVARQVLSMTEDDLDARG